MTSCLIVGGGLVGLCTAHFLAERDEIERVTIVDRDWSHGRSSSARSVAAIRQQFRTRENVELSRFGNAFFADARRLLGTGVGYEPAHYLVLAAADGVERMREAHAAQRAAGAEVVLLAPDELRDRFDWLNVDDVAIGALSLSGEGWIDPVLAMQGLEAHLRDRGVELVEADVDRFEIEGGVVRSLRLADGSALVADAYVNAGGPQSGRLMARSGMPLPVESRKRCAFVFDAEVPPADYPCLVDPTVAGRSVFSRPYAGRFLAVTSPAPASDPDTDDLAVDEALFDEVIRPGLAHRVRGFGSMRLADAWAGHYEVNTYDQNAFIGPVPGVANLHLNCGYSGHGVMHAPAAGRGLAELLAEGRYTSIDLAPFSAARLQTGQRLDDLQPSEARLLRSGV